MIAVFRLALSLLPAPIQVLILGIVGFLILIIVCKIVAFVLDMIPFL